MRDNEIKHDISKIALQAAEFPHVFLRAAEQSPEKGALTAVAFASDISRTGVPLSEAFQTVCNILGCSSLELPRQVEHYKEKPSEELFANKVDYSICLLAYEREVTGNALSIARAVLGKDKTYRQDHRINI